MKNEFMLCQNKLPFTFPPQRIAVNDFPTTVNKTATLRPQCKASKAGKTQLQTLFSQELQQR